MLEDRSPEELNGSSIELDGTDLSVLVDTVTVFLVRYFKILVGFKAVNVEVFVTKNELDLFELIDKTAVVTVEFVFLVFVLIEV